MDMIPKTVHYIWVGSPMPEHITQQIEKNNRFLSGYSVKIWTEANMPPLNPFAKEAYAQQRWAFVADYLRFVILYEEGGIYLDTDMDLLKPLESLRKYPFFAGWNRGSREVYAGIIGARAKHPYIKSILEVYEKMPAGSYPTSPDIMTECYRRYEPKEELQIFPSRYFYPLLDGERATPERMKDAYTNHLWHESWRSFVPLRRFLRRIGVMKLYHRALFGFKRQSFME